jgi:hypothetical protein
LKEFIKLLSRITNPRSRGGRNRNRTDGYHDVPSSEQPQLTQNHQHVVVDDVFQPADESDLHNKMSLPPRYRFRDLLLGDFAFTDDGQR